MLIDEAYLLILTRRPTATALAGELGVHTVVLTRILLDLSKSLRNTHVRLVSEGTGKDRVLRIEKVGGPGGKPIGLGSATLGVRKKPAGRPGLKPEDEVIYARDW